MPDSQLKLQLLGPVEATIDGRPVSLGPKKQRALLAVLALNANETVSLDRLVDALWGDRPPATARKMVQLYVSQLRPLLAEDSAQILTQGRGYELRIDPTAVDVASFERLVDEAAGGGSVPNDAAKRPSRSGKAPPRGRRERALRSGGDPPPRGAATASGGARDRRRPGARPRAGGARQARASHRCRSAARAPLRAANARPLSGGQAGGGARIVLGGTSAAGGGGRCRARQRAPGPAGANAATGPVPRGRDPAVHPPRRTTIPRLRAGEPGPAASSGRRLRSRFWPQ